MRRTTSERQNTSWVNCIEMHITVTHASRDCKDESGQHMVARKEVWARQPNGSRGAFSALRISKMRTDLLEHRAATLREKRAIELAQLPTRRLRLCAVVGAAQTRARQYRGYVQLLEDGREYLFAGASKVLHTSVLLDHGACHRGCLVQIIGASTVGGASIVSVGIRGCHHDIGLRLRSLFGDRRRRTPSFEPAMVAAELARSRFS